MDWYPNEDAVLHFVDAIWPRIRRACPLASFAVVGRNPSARVRALAEKPGVHVSGTVADVRPLVGEGAVYVVPLRVGGGTRLKIFEALAMGKAVVSTTVGAEGLGLRPGRHLLLADDPQAFADAVVTLLGNRAMRRAIGAAGRRLVDEEYSWARVAADFESQLFAAVAAHRGVVAAPHGASEVPAR
jgi:glycosyltransferase involved in cell wall biosynthesis